MLETDQIESYLKDIIGVDIDDNEAVSNFSCLVMGMYYTLNMICQNVRLDNCVFFIPFQISV